MDAWVAQLNTKNGKLQKFIGNQKDITGIENLGAIPTSDMSDELVTDELLPNGDNRIDPTEGIDTSVSVVNYGQILSNLGNIFDPNAQNSFSRAFIDGVSTNDAPFLNQGDRNFLHEVI